MEDGDREFRETIKSVSCGRVHTVLLTEDGRILITGKLYLFTLLYSR